MKKIFETESLIVYPSAKAKALEAGAQSPETKASEKAPFGGTTSAIYSITFYPAGVHSRLPYSYSR